MPLVFKNNQILGLSLNNECIVFVIQNTIIGGNSYTPVYNTDGMYHCLNRLLDVISRKTETAKYYSGMFIEYRPFDLLTSKSLESGSFEMRYNKIYLQNLIDRIS